MRLVETPALQRLRSGPLQAPRAPTTSDNGGPLEAGLFVNLTSEVSYSSCREALDEIVAAQAPVPDSDIKPEVIL